VCTPELLLNWALYDESIGYSESSEDSVSNDSITCIEGVRNSRWNNGNWSHELFPGVLLPTNYILVKTRMTVLQETTLRRRHFARMLESMIATSALFTIVCFPIAAMAQSPSCGLEQPNPTCGVESPCPSCGCESPLLKPEHSAPIKGPVCYRPRSLSFAEKFLKHLDRVGDQVEWEASRKSSPTCSCGANNPASTLGPSCGCESATPSAGAGMPSCGCGPSVPFGLPNATSRNNASTYAVQPFVNNPGRAGQGGQPGSSASATPMFPNKPKESQAIGKISDNGTVGPKIEKPVAAPVPKNQKTDDAKPAPVKPQLPTPEAKTEIPESKTENAVERGPTPTTPSIGLPQTPNSSPVDSLPVLQPTPTEDNKSLPSENQTPSLPPALPQSQDEIPDVLIDPFKDDASWKGNRNRLNGVRLTSGEAINPLRPKTGVAGKSQPKLLPTPHNDDVAASDELPPVLVKQKVISRYQTGAADSNPKVNRVAVPTKRD